MDGLEKMTAQFRKILGALFVVLFIQSCSTETQTPNTEASIASPAISVTAAIPATSSSTQSSNTEANSIIEVSPASTQAIVTVDTSDPDFWKDLPVVPDHISPRVLEIYQRGLAMGNNPNAFSKVGDCNSTIPYFLANYDGGSDAYNLGEYESLQPTIDYFNGSYGRKSLVAKVGMSTAGALASLWSDWKQCGSNETPLDCEYRIQRPSFAIISLGTNEALEIKRDKAPFEPRLRRIIEHSIDQGVVPILSTKADNDEGDHYINQVTARLALEYDLPLWNYWKAVQPLPQHGLRDAAHLTAAPTRSFADFSNPEYLTYGWQVRNLTALQVLDLVRREVTQAAQSETPTAEPTAPLPASLSPDGRLVSTVDGMPLVHIPAGTFEMGSESGNPDQSPVHTVSLDEYYIDATEVTNAMYATFLNEMGNQTEGGVTWLDTHSPRVLITDKSGEWQSRPNWDNYPIVAVSWFGANAYCTWAGRQLPTEAQWEFAAKGSEGFRFPWGNADPDCDHARYAGCGTSPVEVGSLTLGATPLGIFDLAGNVAEWVNDRYAPDYYLQSPAHNPTGPSNGYYRVIRGGYWGSVYLPLQTSNRDWAGADTHEGYIGFRCVLTP